MPPPKHILVVDDDATVRQVIGDQLLALGYRVSLVDGGEAMRAFLESPPDPVDVIILDALMPGERSDSLALHAQQRGIRVMMVSGSLEKMQQAEDRGEQLLPKPFRLKDLEEAVNAALAGPIRTDTVPTIPRLMTEAEAAVLEAAKKWLVAKEAVLAVDEAREDPKETERAQDQAETEMTEAVYRLLGRGPIIPSRDR